MVVRRKSKPASKSPAEARKRSAVAERSHIDKRSAEVAVEAIGLPTRPIEEFIRMPKAHGVTRLVDVRQMQMEAFTSAVDDLIQRAKQDCLALMCAEAVPWRCHRSLIADALLVRGIQTADISSATRLAPHRLTPFAEIRGSTITYPADATSLSQPNRPATRKKRSLPDC
jgi:hypothetical protein